MRISEYSALDATALAEELRKGTVSPREVHDVACEAIAEVNPRLNFMVQGPLEFDGSIQPAGPFADVPTAAKDMGGVAGLPFTAGSRLVGPGITLDHDSHVIALLKKTGLRFIGSVTTPELAFHVSTESVRYGATRNPWDVSLTAGGSSGGTSAAVASGALAIAHGSDGGGSLRIPASYTGLVGLKPTRGLIPYGPDTGETLSGMAVNFILARTLRDTATALDHAGVPMPGGKYLVRRSVRSFSEALRTAAPHLKVALMTTGFGSCAVDPEVAQATALVAAKLEDLGHQVEQAHPSIDWSEFLRANADLWAWGLTESVAPVVKALGVKVSNELVEHYILPVLERGTAMTALDAAAALNVQNKVSRTVGEFFHRYDLLVTPTTNGPAFPLGLYNANDPKWSLDSWVETLFSAHCFTPVFNLTGTPAISVPLAQTNSGLPIGTQLCAGMGNDGLLFQVAAQLEQEFPWQGRRPPIYAGEARAAPA